MVAVDLIWEDLLPFAPDLSEEKAITLIAGTLARAAVKAPCILDPAFPSTVAAQDVIKVAVLRRVANMGGRVVTETQIGTVSLKYEGTLVDGIFSGSEIAELQQMCRDFSGDAAPSAAPLFCMPDPPKWPDPVERCW